MKNLPPNRHHVCLALIDDTVFDVNKWPFTRTKNRSVSLKDYIFHKMCFRCREMHHPSFKHKKKVMPLICWDQRKSIKKIHSASSAPTQAKEVEAGSQNVLYTLVRGLSRNVFPEFAGPQIITFLNLLRPLPSSYLIVFVKVSLRIPFCSSTPQAQVSHCPLHPETHSPCAASSRISIRHFLERSSFS